jgi:hypothetical protein
MTDRVLRSRPKGCVMDSQLAELPNMQVVTYSEDSSEGLERQGEKFQSQENEETTKPRRSSRNGGCS